MADKRTPSDLLAAFLFGGNADAGDWENAVRLAFTWRVIPQLRDAIRNANVDLPDNARQLLTTLSAASAAQSAAICVRAGAAVSALNKGGVKATLFKGAGNVASIYGTPARRMLSDADVLIQHSDFARASEILASTGFKAAIDIPLDEWMSLLEDRVYRAHDFLDFVDDSGTRIDLHWQVRTRADGAFTVQSILESSKPAKLGGHDVMTVSPTDSVLLTVHHITRERLAPSSAVKDLLDVQCWLAQNVTIADLVTRAREANLTVSLVAVLGILATMNGSASVLEANQSVRANASTKDVAAGDKLASMFYMQLKGIPISEIGIGLSQVSAGLIARYLVSRARSVMSGTYRRHKFAGDESRSALTEAKAFVADLASLSPQKLAAYRALARESKY